MVPIVQKDEPILRGQALPVPVGEISSKKIQDILARMSKALEEQKDGIAIAAPQIGESLRIFVVSDELLQKADPKYKGMGKNMVFINPEIIKISKKTKEVEEGCLSVRWFYGKVKRATKAYITACDENGNRIERGGSGILAQVFQHEMDHLNGTLFIDKTKEIWEMTAEEVAELTKQS